MHDDDVMDGLLRDVMAADAPQLSSAFEARVVQRVRPRRLTATGRVVIAAYTVAAVATAMWWMADLPAASIAAAVVVGVPAAAGASAYARRFASIQG
jgi:hypothetical protein